MVDGETPEIGIVLRPVEQGDRALLLWVVASTREGDRCFVDWNDEQWKAFIRMQLEAQCRHYTMHFPRSEHMMIQRGGCPVGRIWVHRGATEIRLLDVSLLVEHRGQGTGTYLIRQLQSEARRAKLPLHHSVDVANEGARRLYERLGFKPVETRGLHTLMEWVPPELAGTTSV